MVAVQEVSPSTVMRHWHANGLKPHLMLGVKISRDPKFVEKREANAGLYKSQREHALVLCRYEKRGAEPHAAGPAAEERLRPDDVV